METIPSFLRAMFKGTSLAAATSTLVAIEPSGTILWTNAAWRDFARANGGDDVLTRFGVGRSYFDGIAPPLRSFYEGVVQNALLTGEPFEQEYECSSPDTFRALHLRVLPFGADGALLEHSVVVEHAHEGSASEPLEALYRDEHGMMLQCSNCRRVRRLEPQSWDWVREWVVAPAQLTSHGICKTCIVYYWGTRLRGK
jgi:hypothetical protein